MTPRRLKSYQIAERFECPKCNHRICTVRYCKGRVTLKPQKAPGERSDPVYECSEEVEGEHMHRVCENCGYVELRSTLDTEKELAQSGK